MTAPETFPDACRRWRRLRKLSQLDLALAAEVSQRHVSWLETGRSRPSREMVLRLSEALEVPLRDRNLLLQAAGFAAHYRESSLNDPLMGAVREALVQVLDNHEPFPAVVVDRRWNVKLLNRAAELMLDLASDLQAMQVNETVNGEWNLAQLTLHPLGLRHPSFGACALSRWPAGTMR
ncbi:MAG: helix-turn-helix domain-containing protein [Pseudomonadota bacterium]